MDEAEKYQKRLQAIAEKRRMQEMEEKVRRETEEEWLKLAQHKRKSLREQWLMEETPSSADPELQSVIPTPQTTEQSADKVQSSDRQMKKEIEKTENMNEESSQIGENLPSIHSADNTEKPAQVYLGEEERNVLGVMEVKVERKLLSKAAQKDTEEKRKGTTEDQEINQVAVDAVELINVPHHSLEQNRSPDEAHFSLADRKMELIMPEGNAEVEEEEWEMVNCSPEEGLDLVLTSDLTQTLTDLGLSHQGDGAVLKMEQVFVMDEEGDLEIGASEVISLVVAAKKSDLENTSRESQPEGNRGKRPPESALQTLYLEKGAHAGISPLSNVPGRISKEPPVYAVKDKQNLSHLPAQTTQVPEDILGDNTVSKGDQSVSASRICKQRKMIGKGTEQESEIQILTPSSVIPKRAETVTRKTCHCCTVM